MAMSVEDRQRLSDQIRDWNACRLELFEISQPDPNGEFFGVIRFFFQEAGEKVATKCIRISNTMTTRDIIGMLVEKFRPDMRMLTTGTYALYEVHFSEERRLADNERPLMVQLSWSKGDREGRFLLKNESEPQQPPKEEMKRRLSKREKKEAKREPIIPSASATGPTEGKENKPKMAEMLYKEVPETSFTRTVSNPEAVMRRRRQQKLEKLQQVQRQEGGARGNIIKIFGEMIDPSIPYKTVLLSRQDTAAQVVRDMLVKYGREQDNPNNYCLLLVQLQPVAAGQELQRVECILQDSDSPLVVAQQLQPEYIRFEICPRNRLPPGPNNVPQQTLPQQNMPHQQPQNLLQTLPAQHAPVIPGSQPLQRSLSADLLSRQGLADQNRFPFLKELGSDGRDLSNGKVILLDAEVTDLGRMPRMGNNHNVQLMAPGVQPQHCVIARMDGITTITPFSSEADTYVNNMRIHETTMLENGVVVRFGRQTAFRFFDPTYEMQKQNSGPRPPPGAVRVLPPNIAAEIPTSQQRALSPVLMPGQALPTMNHQPIPQVLPSLNGQSGMAQIPNDRLDELPASLVLGDYHEDRFLSFVIMDSQSTNSQFRLAPSFVLYMVARFRLTNRYQPQPPVHWQDKPQKVMVFLEKVATTIRRAIQAKPADVGYLAFWLANSSELLNFLRCDLDLSPLSETARIILTEAVQMSFHYLVNAVHIELNKAVLPSFFAENDDDLRADQDAANRRNTSTSSLSSGASDAVQLLTVVMSLSRRCRINAGLTIQLFSHWFHFINHRIFNTLIQSAPRYCTRPWGGRLLRRLNAVHAWAEKNGLELAVDTHLERARQSAVLLEAAKDSPAQAGSLAARIYRLNSMQVKALLDGCARAVAQGLDTAHLSRQFVETLLAAARQTADEALRAAGFDVTLYEREDLNARFLMPDDGYASDVTKDLPPGLQDFVQPLVRDQLCAFNPHQGTSGSWVVYFTKKGAFSDRPPSEAQQYPTQIQQHQHPNAVANGNYINQTTPNRMSQHLEMQHPPHSPSYPTPNEPPLITIQLQKLGNSLGLSIVAARGEVNKQRGIYVKSVVPNGAAYLDGRIKEGDQLVEVDGRSLQGLTQESAAEMLCSTGQVVTLLVAKQAAMYHGVAMLLGQSSLPNQPLPYSQNGHGPISPQPVESMQYAKPEYARPRSHNEDLIPHTPQQPQMAQSLNGSISVAQPAIQKLPQSTSEPFVAPSYENWNQSQVSHSVAAFSQQSSMSQLPQPQNSRMIGSTSAPNLAQQQWRAPFKDLLPVSLATKVVASTGSPIMPKVDIQPEILQPSFYANTTPLKDSNPHFERMVIQFDDYSRADVPPYQPPNPERRMLVPLPQIPLVEVKAKDTQPEFFRPLRQAPQQPPSTSPSRNSGAFDGNYMHLSDLASSQPSSVNRSRLSSSGSAGPLLQQPMRQSTSTVANSMTTTSTFSTTIGRSFESQQPPAPLAETSTRRVGFASLGSSASKESATPVPITSPAASSQLLLNSARKNELAELESRSILTQAELERLRQLRIGNGHSNSEPHQRQTTSGDERPQAPAEDLENRRNSLQTSVYRDAETERRREEEIEQMRVQKEMERVNLRKAGMVSTSPTQPASNFNGRQISSSYTGMPSSNPPAPTGSLAGGILSGSYTVSSPASSPKLVPKLNIVAKPVPPPVAPKPTLSGPKPYPKPSVAPKPAPMSQSMYTPPSAPVSSWRQQASPSPPPPPLPSSPPPSDLPDEYDRRPSPSGVIGKAEVYRDPRDRILQERAYYEQQDSLSIPSSGSQPSSASRLTFHDKMRLFAHEAGEATPKDRVKASRTLLQIEAKLQTH